MRDAHKSYNESALTALKDDIVYVAYKNTTGITSYDSKPNFKDLMFLNRENVGADFSYDSTLIVPSDIGRFFNRSALSANNDLLTIAQSIFNTMVDESKYPGFTKMKIGDIDFSHE